LGCRRFCNWWNGATGVGNWTKEVSRANWQRQSSPPRPNNPKNSTPLKNLWKALHADVRRKALQTLGRVVAQQLKPLRDEGVKHEE
jgi:hypothetical protein